MATILIADDAAFMRNSLQFLLEGVGHTVIAQAKNGQEAINLYKQHKPDIVLLDILMQGVDGIAALSSIMRDDPKARVIMVSALGTEDKRNQAMTIGALGFVSKPFVQDDITNEVKRVLAVAV